MKPQYAVTATHSTHCYAATVPTFAALQSKIAELQAAGYRGIGFRFFKVAA